MNISILTLFPELYQPFLQTSLLKRAQQKGLAKFTTHSLFDYTATKQRIDAPTFGHNSGMLIKPEVIEAAVNDVEAQHGKSFKIMLSPQGKKIDQHYAKTLWNKISSQQHVVMLASRYEGIDARVEEHYADEVISVGDFITMGGDIPAMLLIECLFRFMPGIVGKKESVDLDSFSGAFVDHPEYTKPVEWKGLVVPEVLRSGNHEAIIKWRKEKAAEVTVKKHFGWLRSCYLSKDERQLAEKYIPSHYAALLHNEILLKEGRVGTTSVTSIDIHRSCMTYGLKNLFLVTELHDQQEIVQTILNFWREKDVGGAYNQARHEAVKRVKLTSYLDEVIADIKQKEGKKPIIIGTSARIDHDSYTMLTYQQQDIIWQQDRPVLFLFGTGHGMSEKVLKQCDYMLHPLFGFSDYNHLSVRSAAAIIFDKWLGFALKE